MDHFEEENFCLEAKQARVCFASCNNVPPSINVHIAASLVTTAVGLEEQASGPVNSGYISCA